MQLLTFEQKTHIEQTLVDDDYISELGVLAKEISKRCEDASNEATVVNVFDIQLFLFLRKHFHLDYYPEKEVGVSTVRHVARGKIDSKVGALVIEYKQPSKLQTARDEAKATQQITEYIEGLYKQKPADYIGFITDGTKGKLVEMHFGKVTQTNWSVLSPNHLDRLIKSVVLLDKMALTPENLIDSFCVPTSSSLVKKMVGVLFDTLQNSASQRTQMLYEEWKQLFKLAHDDSSKQLAIEERSRALATAIGHELKGNEEEYRALYSLQTAYAIIVKIIAYKVACNAKFDDNFFEFSSFATASPKVLMAAMQRLEDGAVFRDIGIGNLLEGDFFAWYCETGQWNEDIAERVSSVFEVLTRYEDIAIFGSKDSAQDLFRELYLHIMPDKVRHSLGEFYTPTWLAENVVSSALKKIDNRLNWSGLDPCAGSGTFVNVMIQKVLDETQGLAEEDRLDALLRRVHGVDLNPLAVLTARVNYFINVAGLLDRSVRLEIPVYLGDASYVPELRNVQGTDFYQYTINTLKKPLNIQLPVSVVQKQQEFSAVMTKIEDYIKSHDEPTIVEALSALVEPGENKQVITDCFRRLASDFVELERNNWNGIWARIVTNFLTTASLSKVDILVGNPPWIDWKTLPAGYRERIKGLCISRLLFSGDRVTGGINLNICALISNVAAQKWMKDDGVMAFLMPKPLLFQQSYEGFRNLITDDGSRLYFEEVHDWTKSGHPFKPVQQEFLTYFVSRKKQDYKKGIKVVNYLKKPGAPLSSFSKASLFSEVAPVFNIDESIAVQSNDSITAFSYAKDASQISVFNNLAGASDYKGREGIEFYPQELFLLERLDAPKSGETTIMVQNYQNQKSKHKIASEKLALEKDILHPLIKGVNIGRFHIADVKYVVPFPYDEKDTRTPMVLTELTARYPLLAKYLLRYRSIMESQTSYNDRIIGKKTAEFYALARVGNYTFAPHHVAFRDNTKWQAAVVSATDSWHGLTEPVFQNHAASISERPDGPPISYDEAHYICAVMNAPIVGAFIKQSSDSRTFKIRPPFKIPLYSGSKVQNELAELSVRAHASYRDKAVLEEIDALLDLKYAQLIEGLKA